MRRKWGHFTRENSPLLHTKPGCSDPPPVASNKTNTNVGVILHGEKLVHSSCTQNRAVPTHHRTPDAPRWRSRLAPDVGEGQKRTRCIDSPVRRHTGWWCQMRLKCDHCTRREHSPLLHTKPDRSDPPPVASNKTNTNVGVILHGKTHPFCTQNRAVPTHHRTPDAPRLRSRLALGVGEGQKRTRCIHSPVRRQRRGGGVK
jgi:hypothetical protein